MCIGLNLVYACNGTHTHVYTHLSHPVADTDYEGLSMNLTFDGDTSIQTVAINANADDAVEDEESFILSLSSTDSAVSLQPANSTVTITDKTSE